MAGVYLDRDCGSLQFSLLSFQEKARRKAYTTNKLSAYMPLVKTVKIDFHEI